MKLARKPGSTSVILSIFIADTTSTTGGGLTGLAHDTAGLKVRYFRDHATSTVSVTLANMTLGTYTSGGFKEIDGTNMQGWYQFCPPDAAFDSGADSVCFHVSGATNMVPLPIEIDLNAQVDLVEIAGQTVSASGTVTFPAATLASTTNITAASGITLADGAITAAKIATGAFTAAKFASDFFTSVTSGVWDALTSGLSTVGSIGKLLVDNINVALSTLATATNLAAAKTVLDAVVLDTDELQQEWADGGRLDLILDARSSQTSVDTVSTNVSTLLTRLSSARAGYLDNLNVAGVVATQADITALNQSASRRIIITSVPQYERPESGNSTYTIEVRTYTDDGAAVNADTTPTLTATGIISGSLAANLGAGSNPATGVYRWAYTTSSSATLEQIRFDVSADISATTFTLSLYSQVVDFVAATWTSTDATRLQAIFDKLPSRSFLLGTAASSGAFTTADIGLASGDLDTKFSSLNTKVDTIDGIVDTILIDSNELQTDWTDGGRLDLILDARASQTSVNSLQTSVNAIGSEVAVISSGVGTLIVDVGNVPNNSEFNTAIGTITTAISALNDLSELQVETIVTEAINDAALASSSMLTAVQKMVEADVTIDKTVTPWAVVWKERGTATEILRKRLKDVDGVNITSVSTVIGQTVQ